MILFPNKKPSLDYRFSNLFFSRLKRSSKCGSSLLLSTNPVNALYEFTTGQHEAFFPPPLLLHRTWNESMVDRIFASQRRVSFQRLQNIYRLFLVNFSRNWISGKLINSQDSPSVIIGLVSKYHVLHRQVSR